MFEYHIKHFSADGALKSEEVVHNLTPTVGLNYLLNVGVKGATASSAWFVGVYLSNYTPTISDTLISIVSAGSEYTSYTESTRPAFSAVSSTTGSLTNVSTPAVITMPSGLVGTVDIRGAFVCDNSAKGNAIGTLLSAALFSAAKTMSASETLTITAVVSLTAT